MSTRRKFPTKLGQPMVRANAKPTLQAGLNDTTTVVARGGHALKSDPSELDHVIDISSDSSSAEEYDDEDDEDVVEVDDDSDADADGPTPNGHDADMGDAAEEQDEEHRSPRPENADERGEPSFGDLVIANTSEMIDVADAFHDSTIAAPAYPQSAKLQPPSGASLRTVLTQALKTNDLDLLESCLQTLDITTIRATIQRLDSPLAGTLLQKLAERLHRRPGRAGSLMVWVQWTLVTHGGYLATQPDLIKKLAELNRVIDERARGLQSLLSLKGKLDMLEAQMQLRRTMRQQQHHDDHDDEEGVIYVEGQDDDDDSSEEPKQKTISNGARGSQSRRGQANGISGNQSDISETMPVTSNGIIPDSDADDDDDDDNDDDDYGSSDAGNLMDDEADETDADSADAGDEDEVDYSDVDEMEEEDDSDDAAPPPPKRKR